MRKASINPDAMRRFRECQSRSRLAALPERHRKILRMRFVRKMTYTAIGEELRIHREEARRLSRIGLNRLVWLARHPEERPSWETTRFGARGGR